MTEHNHNHNTELNISNEEELLTLFDENGNEVYIENARILSSRI